ncbi:hypothetical protein BG28_04940 [Nesterenkonia sp. AN1]|uniref:Uncharacterized protein DUF4244 n=1 Tax=Nesterenkonia aurantiaca TaxID=1436010 RepID=A0A4R7G6E2_9MICC|nr:MULTISPECIES: DUF4244 domain-containing protein [Nesterenkonia]EXF24586.1 hypothetical protein BG28_04940 [Nesterenkonia sp. AN1]TDS87015.1 uncharacterized protein DUF4244 [Nesterenkonia aurantiaca]
MEHPVMERTVTQPAVLEAPPARSGPRGSRHWAHRLHHEQEGLATAEYGIVMLAAVGFAGLLVAVLSSGTARGLLTGVVERALSF